MSHLNSKFTSIFSNLDSVCPDSLVLEQASSLPAALFTASLIGEDDIVADLTAGMGANAYCFAKKAKFVYAIEIDAVRANCLKHNFKIADINNVEVVNEDCKLWLNGSNQFFDVVYADPARRTADGKKLVRLEDCSPDVVSLLPLLKLRAKRLLVKASPLLDMSAVRSQIKGIEGFSIIEHNREVKELLIDINLISENDIQPYLKCVVINKDNIQNIIEIDYNDYYNKIFIENKGQLGIGGFLYEPSPSIMKSGRFGFLSLKFPDLVKLAPNTHLFYSLSFNSDFPGRVFRIEALLSSKDLKKIKNGSFNVISRNHPAKASEIEKRFKFNSSDADFIIACSSLKDKIILKTHLVENQPVSMES